VAGRMELSEGSQFCLKLGLEGDTDYSSIFTIDVVDTWIYYPLIDCYLSDDPEYHFIGFCSCPPIDSTSCSACSLVPPANSSAICMDGHTTNRGCILGGSAVFCSWTWLNGGSRFKVCSMGSPHAELTVSITHNNITQNSTMFVDTPQSIGSIDFNLTLFSPRIDDISRKYRILFDDYNSDSFLMVPLSESNGIETNDPTKVGWFRPNRTSYPLLKSMLNAYTVNCGNDEFKLSSQAQTFDSWVELHPKNLNGNLFPGSIIIDPESSQIQTKDTVRRPDLVPLQEGCYLKDLSGKIFAIGLTSEGKMPFTDTKTMIMGIVTDSCGMQNGQPHSCGRYVDTWSEGSSIFSVLECSRAENSSCWGICVRETNTTTGAEIIGCNDDAYIPAIQWPSNKFAHWLISTGKCLASNLSGSDTIFSASTALLIPPTNVLMDFVLNLEEVKVSFISSTVTPAIVEIDAQPDVIKVWIKSLDNKGNCLILSRQDIFYSRSISITREVEEFDLIPSVRSFKGDTILEVQCYKKSDMVRFFIEIKNRDPEINPLSISDNEIREASLKLSLWDKIIYGFKLPFIWMSGGFEMITDFGWWSTLIYFILIACLILAIIIVWMVIKYIKSYISFVWSKLRYNTPIIRRKYE